MARYHTRACLEGARQSYRAARTELAESVPPHAVDGMLAALRTEGFKLADTARAVELVEHALRGEVPAPPSGDGTQAMRPGIRRAGNQETAPWSATTTPVAPFRANAPHSAIQI